MTREEAKEYIYECLDYTEATEVIKALEQEPKTGHWIEPKSGVYKCSSCGRFAFEWGGQLKMSRYCPNCGCRMESEDKE